MIIFALKMINCAVTFVRNDENPLKNMKFATFAPLKGATQIRATPVYA